MARTQFKIDEQNLEMKTAKIKRPMVEQSQETYPNKWWARYAEKVADDLGVEPITMGYGDPAVGAKVPPHFQSVLTKHIGLPGAGAYSGDKGEQSLLSAFERYIRINENIDSPVHLAVGTAGGRSIITSTLKASMSRGDVMIVPEPGWGGYTGLARDAGIHIVGIPTTSDHGFVPTPEGISSAIKTAERDFPNGEVKMMMMNTPHNPTGAVWPESDIVNVLKSLREHNITGLADYTYRAIRREGKHIPSFHNVAEKLAMAEEVDPSSYTDHLVAMQTLGKVSLTPGFRVGYVMSTNPNFINKFCDAKQANDLSGHVFLQKAWAEYLNTEGQKDDFSQTVDQFKGRREYFLEEIAGYGYTPNSENIVAEEVGFYLTFEVPEKYQKMEIGIDRVDEIFAGHPFIRETVTTQDYKAQFGKRNYVPAAELFALDLVGKTGVAVCPGHLFSREPNKFSGYENWVRVALIQPENKLEEMFERIASNRDLLHYKS